MGMILTLDIDEELWEGFVTRNNRPNAKWALVEVNDQNTVIDTDREPVELAEGVDIEVLPVHIA